MRAWHWILAMALGQAVALAMSGGLLGLLPLAVIAMNVLSLPPGTLVRSEEHTSELQSL